LWVGKLKQPERLPPREEGKASRSKKQRVDLAKEKRILRGKLVHLGASAAGINCAKGGRGSAGSPSVGKGEKRAEGSHSVRGDHDGA